MEEGPEGYRFTYDAEYLSNPRARPISLSLPLRSQAYFSPTFFAFFEGLVPEGWYLDILSKKLKVSPEDSFGILLASGKHTVGAVSLEPIHES